MGSGNVRESSSDCYEEQLYDVVGELDKTYLLYPECRWLPTQSRMYRNIILDSYLIICRVTDTRVEVLNIVSSRISVAKIRASRSLRIKE